MMIKPILKPLLAMACFMALQHAQATIIFTQDFDANLNATSTPSDFDQSRQLADNFTLSSATSVNTFRWIGLYVGSNTPEDDDFTVRLFSDSASLPETNPTLLDFNAGNAVNRVDTGVDAAGFDLYSYEFTLPTNVSLSSGSYWFSVVNNTSGDTDDNWQWTGSTHNIATDIVAFRLNDGEVWTSSITRQQFEIAAVPLPAAFWLFASGLGFLLTRRKKTS